MPSAETARSISAELRALPMAMTWLIAHSEPLEAMTPNSRRGAICLSPYRVCTVS